MTAANELAHRRDASTSDGPQRLARNRCRHEIIVTMAVTRITTALVVIVVLAFSATARADGQCVVIYDVEKRTTWRSADGPCASRLSPASTFKIPHALIALETGAIKADSIEKWDGRRFPRQTAW